MAQKISRVPFSQLVKAGNPSYTFKMVVDEDKCNGCGQCAIECPSRIIDMIPKNNCAQTAFCFEACLSSNDVRSVMKSVRDGADYEKAWEQLTKVNPLPASVGRICPHPCEAECSRAHLDKAVNLHEFERFIGDYGNENKLEFVKPADKKAEKVAVIGGGPSGLSCAYQLAKAGYQVTVYEMYEELGGMLRYGVPGYRLPKDIVKSEVDRIINLGVEVETGKRLGKDIFLNDLKAKYDAVYLAFGRQANKALGTEGEEFAVSALDFLHAPTDETDKKVVVIGGGSVAMDSASTAVRKGAKEVTVVSLEALSQMPATKDDIALAKEDGINFASHRGVEKIEKEDDGSLNITLKKCLALFDENGNFAPQYGECSQGILNADTVILAIGQDADSCNIEHDGGVETFGGKTIVIKDEKSCQTNVIGVYAGGDVVRHTKAGSIAGAIDMGKRAADSIASFLSGVEAEKESSALTVDEIDQAKYNQPLCRTEALTADSVAGEIKRCLTCGSGIATYTGPQNAVQFNIACCNCHNCVDVCKEKAIKFEYTMS